MVDVALHISVSSRHLLPALALYSSLQSNLSHHSSSCWITTCYSWTPLLSSTFSEVDFPFISHNKGFPASASGKEPVCQCRRHKRCSFDPWIWKIPWRRAKQPTPVFLPGESQEWRGLVGCRLWGRTESDTTEAT